MAFKSPQPTDGNGQAESPAPDTLPDILARNRLSLSGFNSAQVVLVKAAGSNATVSLYECRQNEWERVFRTGGHVGRNGLSADRREGDGTTPQGVYRLGFAFGAKADPGTAMPYRPITKDSYWVTDPKSKYYNMWVEASDYRDWDSAEVLSDYPEQYAYAVVVEYNYPPHAVAGKGSAIFLHCGDKPTSGCIAIPRSDMYRLLLSLDPRKNSVIAVT